jgi:uncharacterized protein YdeI (YjbR/CyaY-like superfamily)
LAAALKKSVSASQAFERMPPSHRREYVKWVGEAKQAETQVRRAAQAVQKIEAWGKAHREKRG